MSDNPIGVAMKEESESITKVLSEDIQVPEFWSDINDVAGITIM
jgi:hypothetical protein